MKRWIHSATDSQHQWHINQFNNHYSLKCANRAEENNKVYFTKQNPLVDFIESYNRTNKGANLGIGHEFVKENGYEFVRYIVK